MQQDAESQLERTFIDEFLRASGYDPAAMNRVPEDERIQILRSASVYAAGKLTEVQARARLLHELHGSTEE